MEIAANGNSIQYIVELDKKARERVAEAKKQAEQIEAEAQLKKKQMFDDYHAHAKKRLEIVEQSYKAEADEKIAAIESDKLAKMAALDKALSENRERLEKQIFEAIINKKS